MISRKITERIKPRIGSGKAIIVLGPRQVGKTTLIREMLEGEDYLFYNGDDPQVRQILNAPNTQEIRQLIGTKKIVFIDEAQRIDGIGLTLKIIIDQIPDVQVWVSGSSSFDLNSRISEPLTGRKWSYELYPISWEEYEAHVGYLEGLQDLENRLIYGFYPDVLNHKGSEAEVLQNLVQSYLYKDVLAFADIRKPEILDNLVQALALQLGSEVNYTELSRTLGIDRNTVIKYIDILEKGFVIFRLRSFSKNIRNEIKKSRKIYFYDNGIRNTIIANYDLFKMRIDKGALWENFLVSERKKRNMYKFTMANSYFWRTTQQQEIDYVEEVAQKLYAYEFKWNPKKKAKISKTFLNNYDAEGAIVHKENFRDFVMGD